MPVQQIVGDNPMDQVYVGPSKACKIGKQRDELLSAMQGHACCSRDAFRNGFHDVHDNCISKKPRQDVPAPTNTEVKSQDSRISAI